MDESFDLYMIYGVKGQGILTSKYSIGVGIRWSK